MCKKIIKASLLLNILYLLFFNNLLAKDLVANVGIIPIHSNISTDGDDDGGFVKIIKAINALYPNIDISIKEFPFARSLLNVETGRADFHLPLIRNKKGFPKYSPLAYVSEPITKVTFVLYTKADRPPLNSEALDTYKIDTLRGHKYFFSFSINETNDIKQGIDKLNQGRSDGFIMEQAAVDNHIRKYKIKNIRRTVFAVWDSSIVIARDANQKNLDNILSSALRQLKETGELQKITSKIHQPYIDWQPYEMDW